jgi:hypothetical protein
MLDSPEEAVQFILGKTEATFPNPFKKSENEMKESAYNEDALRRFRDKKLNK